MLLDVEMGHYSWYYIGTTRLQSYCLVLNRNIEQLIHEQMSSGGPRLPDYRHTPANITELFAMGLKLDQGALGMSDPCGTLQLALIQCPGLTLSFPTFTFVLIDLWSLVKW